MISLITLITLITVVTLYAQAIDLWGEHVALVETSPIMPHTSSSSNPDHPHNPDHSAEVDWKEYVLSRLSVKCNPNNPSSPSKPGRVEGAIYSPAELHQEHYCTDVWTLLICCVLISRVSSRNTKTSVLQSFFEKYPKPSVALTLDPVEALPIMKPLGLFPTRLRAIMEITNRFLTQRPRFEVNFHP